MEGAWRDVILAVKSSGRDVVFTMRGNSIGIVGRGAFVHWGMLGFHGVRGFGGWENRRILSRSNYFEGRILDSFRNNFRKSTRRLILC